MRIRCFFRSCCVLVQLFALLSATGALAGAPMKGETVFHARWGTRLGEFFFNRGGQISQVPEDFELGDEILVPDNVRFQLYRMRSGTWREVSVRPHGEIIWKSVRDRGGTIYYIAAKGEAREVYVVPPDGRPLHTFGRGTLKGYARYIATNTTDQLAVLDAHNALTVYSLAGELVYHVESREGLRRNGATYSPSGELLVFCETGEYRKGDGVKKWAQIYSREGKILRETHGLFLDWLVGVDRRGQIYTVSHPLGRIDVMDASGQITERLKLPATPTASEEVVDEGDSKNILKVDADGTVYQMLSLKKKGLLFRRLRRP